MMVSRHDRNQNYDADMGCTKAEAYIEARPELYPPGAELKCTECPFEECKDLKGQYRIKEVKDG